MVFLIVLVRKNKTMCYWNQSQFDPIFSIGANEETNEQTNKRTNEQNERTDEQNKRIDKPLKGKNKNSLKSD